MTAERQNPDRKRRRHKLTSGMVRIIVTCWIIPYIVISGVLIFSFTRRSMEQRENTVRSSAESACRVVGEGLYAAIEMSRQASYDGVIKRSYETWLKTGDESAMYKEVSEYLNKTYKFSKTISNTILLYYQPMKMEYYTYSNAAGATYASVEEFKRNTAEAVRLAARDLGTQTKLIYLSGHLYVVRNIVLSNYEPFTTLVMEVNMDRMFDSVNSVIWQNYGIAALDGVPVWDNIGNGGEAESKTADESEKEAESGIGTREEKENDWELLAKLIEDSLSTSDTPREGEYRSAFDGKSAAVAVTGKVNGQMVSLAMSLDRARMYSDRQALLVMYLLVFITLIPLLIATFWFFYSNINKPLGMLMKGSERIRKGEYGVRVPAFYRNEEIGALVDTFNHMSVSLEDSFNRIYVEEIAERDATLKALQSQINPHFLNNTLEIINWKARMNGNEDVSEMISALSVMMNATLNRNNEMFIPLSEELSYVDAYLYIIRERFGSRFVFTKEVDETLLDKSIPRLIIQPIVENAVEHGGDARGNITGRLVIDSDGKFLRITVENNGEMTAEDREKIRMLLSTDRLSETERLDRMSIGIRNVNLRLHLIYGEDSGLEITDEDGVTRSVLRIRLDNQRQI